MLTVSGDGSSYTGSNLGAGGRVEHGIERNGRYAALASGTLLQGANRHDHAAKRHRFGAGQGQRHLECGGNLTFMPGAVHQVAADPASSGWHARVAVSSVANLAGSVVRRAGRRALKPRASTPS